MSVDTKKNLHAFRGSAGAQSDFLRRCGVAAHPAPSGARGSAGSQQTNDVERTCAPERTQDVRERNSVHAMGDSAVRTRASGDCEQKKDVTQWAIDAQKVIAALPDDDIRVLLTDEFEETAGFIEFMQDQSREFAEQQAFGAVLFRILELGIDVKAIVDDLDARTK